MRQEMQTKKSKRELAPDGDVQNKRKNTKTPASNAMIPNPSN
jgi:hypothetical protein